MELLTTSEVAHRFNVSSSAVAKWVAAGKLTPVRKLPGVRGPMLFESADVDAFARQYRDRQAST